MNVAMAFVLNYISDKGFLKRYQKAKAVTWEEPVTKTKPIEPRPASPKAKPFFKYNGPKANDAKSVKMSSEEVAVETEGEQSSATDSEQPPQWALELLMMKENQQSGSRTSSNPHYAQAVGGVDEKVEPGVMAYINKFKDELCIFQHRTTARHRVWDCAISVLHKCEQLIALNRCRTCWQEGHTGITCTRKIDYSCEHCGATNHFKPLCYAYIREVAQARLQAGDQKTEVKKVVPQVQAASTYPSFAQAYNLLKANAAQLQRKSAASTAQPTFMVQSTGLPMGPTEQVTPTSQ